MIVPEFWAEARVQHKTNERQVTVKRFGWSDASLEVARLMAQSRAAEALQRIISGEKLDRREPKVPYNGADGVPIREEIVSRHESAVVTRNVYGARCLNTPDVMFADVDFAAGPPLQFALVVFVLLSAFSIGYGVFEKSWKVGFGGVVASLILGFFVVQFLYRAFDIFTGGARRRALRRIENFSHAHPDWHLRLYETPAGFRVLVMHDTFDPAGEGAARCFNELGADPVYARMCVNQRCFRARVSPKPWRIGIVQHMRPRPGVSPVNPEKLPERKRWIEDYERLAAGFASCRFIQVLGPAPAHPAAMRVSLIHDDMCRAGTSLPIA